MNENQKLDCYAVVELMGHLKIAGRIIETTVAGAPMLRVDVPETSNQPAFTKFFGASAVYAITPMEKDTCMRFVEDYKTDPIYEYSIERKIEFQVRKRVEEITNALPVKSDE